VAGAQGGAIGLLLGGALTEYLSWRWTLYVNLLFAGVAFTGGALLLARQPSPVKPRLDIPGALLVSSAVFCLVYGFSNAATHTWATPSTYGFLATGLVLGVAFAAWRRRAAHPLLPRHHGWCSTATAAALGPHTVYATGVLGPLILAGIGMGMVIAPMINTGTFGVAPQDAGEASATVTVGQMLGGSVGTALLNTIFAAAVTSPVSSPAARSSAASCSAAGHWARSARRPRHLARCP
jgi:Major Facilitator Superfamily